MVTLLFGFLSIGSSEQNTIPDFDPHADFISGIIPAVRDQLGLRFEENTPLPSSSVPSNDYLNFYRKCDIKVLAKVGVYPLSGRFIFDKNWSVDEITHRWAEASDAEILLYRTTEEPEDPYIFFTVFVIRPQTIRISVNSIDQKTVKFQGEDQKSVYLKVRLRPGENQIRFSSDSQPLSPENGDPRKLSFGIAKLSVVNAHDL